MNKLLIAVVAALALASCGGDDDDPATLQPADDARTATASAEPERSTVALGETLSVGDLEVTVISAEPLDTDVDLAVRVENPRDREVSPPDFNVICADGSESGRRADSREDAYSFDSLPPRSFEEGKVLLAVPDGCVAEIVLVSATGIFVGDSPEPGRWVLP